MKISILGNGKMGKEISKIAKKRGHIITCIADSKNPGISLNLDNTDVAIEFSTPSSAYENISHAINSGVPVVSGTTAWLQKLKQINELCEKKKGAFLYSTNFSLGANIFFELNKKLAKLMKNKKYKCKIHEIHHTKKLDSPSGTAITLKQQINEINKNKTIITSDRVKNNAGTHQVTYKSDVDTIEIKHTADNRNGFAMGAIIAAEWIIGKKGIYSMKDIIDY
ncbi:MAG: 4-hydroxy-tetrahydrodipicolinate reductase [Flavobacteriales bacterium]|nr:4-hydroxy-tetrahydrodipicolinate reductase [Flavobacteriales bacterium]